MHLRSPSEPGVTLKASVTPEHGPTFTLAACSLACPLLWNAGVSSLLVPDVSPYPLGPSPAPQTTLVSWLPGELARQTLPGPCPRTRCDSGAPVRLSSRAPKVARSPAEKEQAVVRAGSSRSCACPRPPAHHACLLDPDQRSQSVF